MDHVRFPYHAFKRQVENKNEDQDFYPPKRLTFTTETECMFCNTPQGKNHTRYLEYPNGWLYCEKKECKEKMEKSYQPFKDTELQLLEFKDKPFTIQHAAVPKDNNTSWRLKSNAIQDQKFILAWGNDEKILVNVYKDDLEGWFYIEDVLKWCSEHVNDDHDHEFLMWPFLVLAGLIGGLIIYRMTMSF